MQLYYKLEIGADQIGSDQITRILEFVGLAWNSTKTQLSTQNQKGNLI